MADLEPTYYNTGFMRENGLSQKDTHRALYNLWKAVKAICNNLDEDNGNVGQDYLDKIGTDLDSAFNKFQAPSGGPVT